MTGANHHSLRQLMTGITLTAFVGLTTIPQTAQSCSAFGFTEAEQTYVGKNYDWMPWHDHGAVFVNKRGVAKRALTLRTDNTVEWVSRFGSITFSQMGLEFPVSGINESGLTVEILQLDSTQHIPETDPRPALNEAQWLQYQLDNYATLSEVLVHVDELRVEQAFLGVHYFICDKIGECGTFEFIDGSLVVHNGSRLNPQVLTNSTYDESVESLSESALQAKIQLVKSSQEAKSIFSTSLARFATATKLLAERDPAEMSPGDFTFHVLQELENSSLLHTQWSIAYDLNAGVVHFKTRKYDSIKMIALKDLDFNCATPTLMTDIQQKSAGDLTPRFHDFNYDKNKDLIDQNWMLMGADLRQLAADYPGSTRCVRPQAAARHQY